MSSKVKDASCFTSLGLSPNGGFVDGALFMVPAYHFNVKKQNGFLYTSPVVGSSVFHCYTCCTLQYNKKYFALKMQIWQLIRKILLFIFPGGEWTSSHQMTINGKQKGIKNADLLQSAKHMGLGLAEAEKIIDEVGGSISSWKLLAEKAGLREENARAIEKVINQRVS